MPLSKDWAFKKLAAAFHAGRLPHAHLFTGAPGSGKMELAQQLAALVLGGEPRSILAHPDLHLVQPESKSRRIVIEQIRHLEEALHRKPLLGSAKVAIIVEADRLQPAAANAFLKTLEEPPAGCVIILTSGLPKAILETVLSRCVQTALRGGEGGLPPEAAPILDALQEAFCGAEQPGIAEAFRLARAIQSWLAEVRERLACEQAALLKAEAARYKNIPDAAAWLEEREEQLKALTESAALRERERAVGFLFQIFGGAARVAAGAGGAPHPLSETLARLFPPAQIFEKLEALETLRRRLALNVNEALALEAGCLALVRSSPTR